LTQEQRFQAELEILKAVIQSKMIIKVLDETDEVTYSAEDLAATTFEISNELYNQFINGWRYQPYGNK